MLLQEFVERRSERTTSQDSIHRFLKSSEDSPQNPFHCNCCYLNNPYSIHTHFNKLLFIHFSPNQTTPVLKIKPRLRSHHYH